MRPGTAGAAQDGYLLGVMEQLRQRGDFIVGWTHVWPWRRKMQPRTMLQSIAQGHVSGNGHHRHTASRDRRLHGDLQDPRHLLGLRDQLAVITTLRKEMLRMGF